jgi:hypothetical protein
MEIKSKWLKEGDKWHETLVRASLIKIWTSLPIKRIANEFYRNQIKSRIDVRRDKLIKEYSSKKRTWN